MLLKPSDSDEYLKNFKKIWYFFFFPKNFSLKASLKKYIFGVFFREVSLNDIHFNKGFDATNDVPKTLLKFAVW